MKLVINKNVEFTLEQLEKIKTLGYTIEKYAGDEIEGEVYVGILSKPYSELDNIKGLKYIQSTIVGYEMLDMDNIQNRNITYANASGTASAPIAEYVILKILDYYKDASKFRKLQSQGVWGRSKYPDLSIQEVSNKRIMVLGTGSIGGEIAKRLKAFDAVMIGVNSNGRAVENFDETYALENVYTHLKDVDVVVGALPLNDQTINLYDEKFFSSMKEGSIFINVGRGKSMVESAAIDALDKNVAHLYLDVMPIEPTPEDSVLWTHPQVSLTPHNSSSSNLVQKRILELVVENLENYAKSLPLINKVV